MYSLMKMMMMMIMIILKMADNINIILCLTFGT